MRENFFLLNRWDIAFNFAFIRPSKKIRCFSSPPASFFAAASSFLLFTNFNTNLYIALVYVQKMYIQLSNSFGHRSAERILPYENCSYSTVT